MSYSRLARLGGLALMLGALMFMLTKARGYVDSDDSLLVYFMAVGFAAWLVGLAGLFVRYAPGSGILGKIGLGLSFVGIVLLAIGHLFSFIVGPDLFGLVILGVLALIAGPFLFGIAALQRGVLPRYWRLLPIATALMGVIWFNTGSDDGSLTFSFMFFRTLFALGWLLLGYVLLMDKREAVERPTPSTPQEAEALSGRS